MVTWLGVNGRGYMCSTAVGCVLKSLYGMFEVSLVMMHESQVSHGFWVENLACFPGIVVILRWASRVAASGTITLMVTSLG